MKWTDLETELVGFFDGLNMELNIQVKAEILEVVFLEMGSTREQNALVGRNH